MWYETSYVARYITIVKLTYENAVEKNSEGYVTKAVNGYRVVNGYAIEDKENATVTFISEDKTKTPYEAKFYITADLGYSITNMGESEEILNNENGWRWRINEKTNHWQCNSEDWNK